MRRRGFYVSLVGVFLIGVLAIIYAPEATLNVLIGLVIASVIGAVVSTLYLRHVYLDQPKPRSRFFGITLESFYNKIFIGGWVAYLTTARLTERLHAAQAIDWTLPAPPPAVSAPISALVVIVIFASPIRFAIEVWVRRRRSGRTLSEHE